MSGEAAWPLYLWSATPGTGKTSAGLSMLDHCGPITGPMGLSSDVADVMAGFIDFATFPGVVRNAGQGRYTWNEDGRGGTIYEPTLWSHLRACKLVVVDDLRVPKLAEMRLGEDHYGCLKRLLDDRVGKATVVTSNMDPASGEIAHAFDARIADRLLCGTWFDLAGESRRGAA